MYASSALMPLTGVAGVLVLSAWPTLRAISAMLDSFSSRREAHSSRLSDNFIGLSDSFIPAWAVANRMFLSANTPSNDVLIDIV